jgi:hypothetical protein
MISFSALQDKVIYIIIKWTWQTKNEETTYLARRTKESVKNNFRKYKR